MIEVRKTPRQKRSATTVATILEAAARILEQGGLDGFNTNAVAERAGVSVGSLYQYFPAKAAILVALIRRERAALLAGFEAAAEAGRGASLDVAVAAMVGAGVAHQFDQPGLARALDYAEPGLPLDKETDAIDRAIVEAVLGLLRAHQRSLPAISLEEAAVDLAALSKGMIDAAGRRGETDRDALVARVSRAALGYLQTPSPAQAPKMARTSSRPTRPPARRHR